MSSIVQNIKNMDYAWNNPQTYLVFVPGLSLVIQKIQMANILPLDNNLHALRVNQNSIHFQKICKAHLRGLLIQLIISLSLSLFASPLFIFLGTPAVYELLDTMHKAAYNPAIFYEFDNKGDVKGMQGIPLLNFF